MTGAEPRGLDAPLGSRQRRQSRRRTAPNGSSPTVRRRGTARPAAMSSSDVASHSSLVAPQQIRPWPPSTTPHGVGCAGDEVAQREAELEAGAPPGEPPDVVAVALLRRGARRRPRSASAITASGWRWSTWSTSRSACSGVSIDGAAPPIAEAARVVAGRRCRPRACRASRQRFERAEPVEVEQGEPGRGERAEVAARALHREDLGWHAR